MIITGTFQKAANFDSENLSIDSNNNLDLLGFP